MITMINAIDLYHHAVFLQVRFLMKEVEESRGGSVVSSTSDMPELLPDPSTTAADADKDEEVCVFVVQVLKFNP